VTPNDRTDGPDALTAVRQRLADNLTLAVAVLLVLAAVGGWVTYAAHVDPPTENVERTVGTVETNGTFEHAAVVRSENPVHPVGTTLADRRHYFYSVAPVLNGTFVHDYAVDGEIVTVETTLTLALRSADAEGEYWQVSELLADRQVDDADPRGAVTVPFEVNVSDATSRAAEIDDGLGGSPGDPQLAIVAETVVTATVDGERMTTTSTHELPVRPEGSTYAVGPVDGETGSEQVTRSVAEQREYGPIASFGGVLLLLGSLALLGLIVGLHLTGSLRPSEQVRAAVETARHRRALDEWITPGRVGDATRSRPTVTVTSLSGLVDVAIDCDRRVIEDEDRGAYYVVDGEVVYTFVPDGGPGEPLAPATEDDPAAPGVPADAPANREAATSSSNDSGAPSNTADRQPGAADSPLDGSGSLPDAADGDGPESDTATSGSPTADGGADRSPGAADGPASSEQEASSGRAGEGPSDRSLDDAILESFSGAKDPDSGSTEGSSVESDGEFEWSATDADGEFEWTDAPEDA